MASPTAPQGPDGPLKAGCLWRDIFTHVTGRWGFLILIALAPGPLRFHLLRDGVEGISEKMLSQTLKLLIRDGLVSRSVAATVPPQVSYALTPMGREIARRLDEVSAWIGAHVGMIARAQEDYDREGG